MNRCTANRSRSDRYLLEIRRIVGEHLLDVAADAFDWQQATDLMMLNARDVRVAARVRRPGYGSRYPYDFTIRSGVASGVETELSKIVNGSGAWMFYGHASENGKGAPGMVAAGSDGTPGGPDPSGGEAWQCPVPSPW